VVLTGDLVLMGLCKKARHCNTFRGVVSSKRREPRTDLKVRRAHFEWNWPKRALRESAGAARRGAWLTSAIRAVLENHFVCPPPASTSPRSAIC
jgi:hypothetical protein